MPFKPLVFTVLCATAWFGYGCYLCNVELIVSKGLGIMLGFLELSIYAWARAAQRADVTAAARVKTVKQSSDVNKSSIVYSLLRVKSLTPQPIYVTDFITKRAS